MPLTAKLIMENGEQVVHLPSGIQLPGSRVEIRIEGGNLILHPQPDSWDEFFASPPVVPDDFLTNRVDPPLEARNPL